MLICKSTVSRSPLATLNTLGALTLVTLNTIVLAANLLNTVQKVVSMPCKLPSLSNIGIVTIILKLAIGDIPAWLLLLGVRYGSAGATITLLATIVAGGKANVEYVASARAAAIVVRNVVIGAGILSHHSRGAKVRG